jgi:hypothetical protein
MPQDPSTAELGKGIIRQALDREGVFMGKNISLKAVPTSPTSIRFDVQLVTNTGTPLTLSVNQSI